MRDVEGGESEPVVEAIYTNVFLTGRDLVQRLLRLGLDVRAAAGRGLDGLQGGHRAGVAARLPV